MAHITLLSLLFFVNVTLSISIGDESDVKIPDLYQGDIVIDQKSRFAVNSKSHLWPKNTVVYVIDDSLLYIEDLIKDAMKHISNKTCIRFKKRSNEANYVRIFAGLGCYSAVGNIRKGSQPLSLSRGCHQFGTIVHELMHTIGFFHHHMRYDRDKYLDIHWDRIKKDYRKQFRRLLPEEGKFYTPFDYESIMLYGSRAFSNDGFSTTMTAKQSGIILRDVVQKRVLSTFDTYSISKMYGCELS